MKLHTLKPVEGSTKNRKRLGRGEGSTRGGQSTRGHNGQKSRSGYKSRAWFEGGQMPLYRRIPKGGFKNPFRVEYNVLNLDQLQAFVEENPELTTIDHDFLLSKGIISSPKKLVKLLGRGELKSKLNVTLNKFSKTAKAAIEAAGGTTTEV